MRYLCIAIVAPALLLAAGIASGKAGTAAMAPPSPGYEPLPYAYTAPHGYGPHPAYRPPPRYGLPLYAYGLASRYVPPPQYGPPPAYSPPHYAFAASSGYGPTPEHGPAPPGYAPPPSAYGSPGAYGSKAEYGLPRIYDPLPHATQQDPNARRQVWNEIADSFTQALQQVRLTSSRDYSRVTSQFAHTARPH